MGIRPPKLYILIIHKLFYDEQEKLHCTCADDSTPYRLQLYTQASEHRSGSTSASLHHRPLGGGVLNRTAMPFGICGQH